jgi:TRAP-type C4-dicarboxylate transport system substrate-binding protein
VAIIRQSIYQQRTGVLLFKEEQTVKKLFLIPLIIVLAVGLVLGGCKATTTTTAPPTSAPTTVPPTTAPTTAPPTTPVQPIKLTFGSSYPSVHPIEVIHQKWIDKIKEDTNGRVEITLYPSETLIHMFSTWDELTAGVADIAYFSRGSAQHGFLVGKALTVFTYGTDVYVARQIYEALEKEFPEIDAEFAGAKVLWYQSAVGNFIFTKKPVNTLDDLKGLQLQQSPSWPGLVEKLGSTSVNIPFMEMYPSLQKGIIQGTFMPADILKSGSMYEVVSYGVNIHSAAPPEGFTIMNLDSWNRLPPDIQKVFEDDKEWAIDEAAATMVQAEKEAVDFGKEHGVQFTELPQAELDKLYGYMDEIALAKAAELDKEGLPGTKIYNEFKRIKGELLAKK